MSTTERAYTFLETVIVVALVGILLGISAYSIRFAGAREEVDGWVRSIVYDLAAGQQAAITRRDTVTAAFQDQTYTIAVAGGSALRQDTLPDHITFGSTVQVVSFDRRGVPSAEFTLPIISTSTGRSYTIRVEAGTGGVTFSEP